MSLALIIAGVIVLILTLAIGKISDNASGFLTSLIIGVPFAMILFALSKILENQKNILFKLQRLENYNRRVIKSEKKVCSNCSKEYDIDMNSCSYCGYRE